MSIRGMFAAAMVAGVVGLAGAALAQDTMTVSIGQGGSVTIPVCAAPVQNAPYALTGMHRDNVAPAVYQSYGQGQLVIPQVAGR